ncbi:outer membrane lipid asymmetry maintenance protein MlaD [sulfur-oxidizing endosymbiont of Gigantopelta aegis]|uniref:outer membrane lipid asymmetry maintenance protein MlaD n=1 Tax=sulfur-oxidizing endosymbiont of Gigantopelta aegis TaxID=2794934 RepID=UPI0018DB0F56|nr:outer membrane lipid asymmetry maintenance protein MlaD [sulfur-oxidizing endosymbiont of Gigantopelta aegis]
MSNSKILEVSVGVFVAVGIAALLVLAVNVSNIGAFNAGQQYTVSANFDNISGLKERSAVAIAGVTVGRVSSITVDPITFEAVVVMTIDANFDEVPVDSSVGIYTAGLLGEKYVGIEPGGAPDYLEEGSVFRLTQSSIVLEKLISQFLFSQGSDKDDQ